jgi:glycosyltransferase involved in cell wall biosynthesis
LRIANIIEEGKLGGPQVRICVVAAALKGQAETTVFIPVENSKAFQQRCDSLGVPYKLFPITRITKEWWVAVRYVFLSFFEVLRLAWALKKDKFDIVHVSGGAWQYKGLLAARLAGKKVLWHLNDTSLPWVFRTLFSVMSPLAHGYIYSAKRSEIYYQRLVSKNRVSFIIPSPVDTAYYLPVKHFSGDENVIKQFAGKFVIGTISNINTIKGLEVFIDSAAVLNIQFDNLVFVIIGAISKRQERYFARLQVLAKNLLIGNLYFVGDRSDIRPLLSRFDAYVCSSHSESSPMTLWEAMAMKKALVSTDVGDVSMYVKDSEDGFVVNVGDADAMAERLACLIKDPKMRQTFGERAREIAVRELDVSCCAARHLAAYQKILSI